VLVAEIKSLHKASRGTYGSPRIHADLVATGHNAGRKRVAKLMARNGIVGCPKRRRRNTTDSNHNEPPAPNLLNWNFKTDAPNKVWVTDITYIRTISW
jgi:transposase InsO family protein